MPLQSRQLITMKRSYIVIISMNIFSLLYNLPFWFHYEIQDFKISETEFSKSWFFEWFYASTPEFIIFHALPLILIVCGNITILVFLRKFNQQRRDMQAAPVSDVREISITKIILTIIGLDLITNLLLVIRNVLLYSMRVSQ